MPKHVGVWFLSRIVLGVFFYSRIDCKNVRGVSSVVQSESKHVVTVIFKITRIASKYLFATQIKDV